MDPRTNLQSTFLLQRISVNAKKKKKETSKVTKSYGVSVRINFDSHRNQFQ